MRTFELGKILPCTPDEAWNAVIDFPSRTIHGPAYRRSDLPDGQEPRPGNRIELQIGRDKFTSLMTVVQEPEMLSHRTVGPGFSVEFSYWVRLCSDADPGYTSDDDGNAYLTVQAEYGGWLGSLIARLRPGACRRYVSGELAAIDSGAKSVFAEPVTD